MLQRLILAVRGMKKWLLMALDIKVLSLFLHWLMTAEWSSGNFLSAMQCSFLAFWVVLFFVFLIFLLHASMTESPFASTQYRLKKHETKRLVIQYIIVYFCHHHFLWVNWSHDDLFPLPPSLNFQGRLWHNMLLPLSVLSLPPSASETTFRLLCYKRYSHVSACMLFTVVLMLVWPRISNWSFNICKMSAVGSSPPIEDVQP